jgi:hypothetical protein
MEFDAIRAKVNESFPKPDIDAVHEENLLANLRSTISLQQMLGGLHLIDASAHENYIIMATGKRDAALKLATAIDLLLEQTCEELKVPVPANIGNLLGLIPSILGSKIADPNIAY